MLVNCYKDNTLELIARLSLSFLWVFTGITSIFIAPKIGYEILDQAHIKGALADICVLGGGVIDIILGIWLLTKFQLKLCYISQIFIIIAYTILLSFIAPEYWLHPFGPVTKNIPILVLTFFLYKQS
ncbi:MAG: DoxX-like family protein [Proteobacteria bacterium]|nr:DoxX-like family protein [Pseudomonadota bacterium]